MNKISNHKSESPAATGLYATNQNTPADGTPENRAALIILLLAKKGHHVHRLDGGGFLVGNWGYSLHCPGLPELHAFARKVGARS